MKKTFLALGLTVAAVSLFPVSASAHMMYPAGGADHTEGRCDRLSAKLSYIQATNGTASDNSLWRAQRLIDRKSHLGYPQPATIVDALVQDGNFTTLVSAVTAADLAGALSAPGDKTVFAPTDRAFAALPAGTIETLLADKALLTKVLTNHVVEGKVDAATAIAAGQATTLAGNTVGVTAMDGFAYVNGVKVVLNDIYTGNGVVHVTDAVLVP